MCSNESLNCQLSRSEGLFHLARTVPSHPWYSGCSSFLTKCGFIPFQSSQSLNSKFHIKRFGLYLSLSEILYTINSYTKHLPNSSPPIYPTKAAQPKCATATNRMEVPTRKVSKRNLGECQWSIFRSEHLSGCIYQSENPPVVWDELCVISFNFVGEGWSGGSSCYSTEGLVSH